MPCPIPAVAAAAAALLIALPAAASAPSDVRATDPLPTAFLQFFFKWKAEPKNLRFSELRVLDAGGELRVLCGAYDMPGQTARPFLVLGDSSPAAAAAWEPGSFPESDPLYPRLMDDLKSCQTLGDVVTASR